MLWSIVKDEARGRLGFAACQIEDERNRWNCPVEMYQKLPIFHNKTFPYGKFDVLSFCSTFLIVKLPRNNSTLV